MDMITIPDWAKPDAPHKSAIFEVVALAGIEGKWIRMSAADQRAIIGHPVFGKQSICVKEDGTVDVVRKTCFGSDSEIATYTPDRIARAVAEKKRLSPGCYGGSYLDN